MWNIDRWHHSWGRLSSYHWCHCSNTAAITRNWISSKVQFISVIFLLENKPWRAATQLHIGHSMHFQIANFFCFCFSLIYFHTCARLKEGFMFPAFLFLKLSLHVSGQARSITLKAERAGENTTPRDAVVGSAFRRHIDAQLFWSISPSEQRPSLSLRLDCMWKMRKGWDHAF